MGVVVEEDDLHPVALEGQAGDGGVVAVADVGHVLQAQPAQAGDGVTQEGPVREDGDGLVRVMGHDVTDGGRAALAQLLEALAAGGAERRRTGGEARHLLRVRHRDARPGAVLPRTHVDLAQVPAGVEREVLRPADRAAGGGHGAEEVAGIDDVDVDRLEPAAQGLDLAVAVVGDEAVVLAMDAAVEVALGLRVADEVQGGHACPSETWNDIIRLYYTDQLFATDFTKRRGTLSLSRRTDFFGKGASP